MVELGLLTNAKFFDDSAVALDVFSLEVVEQTTTFTNESGQCALCTEVLAVKLKVLGEVVNTEGKEGDLAFSRTRVLGVLAILGK